jgi:hypothetical protein
VELPVAEIVVKTGGQVKVLVEGGMVDMEAEKVC